MSKQRLPIAVDTERPLTRRQTQFVEHILTTGQSIIESAKSLKTQPSNIYRELRKPHVKKEIQRRTLDHIGILSLYAARTQQALLNADSESVRAVVSSDILNRHLGKPVERRQIQLEGQINVVIDLS